jgi:hypothetical protein
MPTLIIAALLALATLGCESSGGGDDCNPAREWCECMEPGPDYGKCDIWESDGG